MIRKYYEYEGLGGGIDPKSTSKAQPMTQSMTKEQIIMSVPIDPTGTEHFTEKEVIQAMDLYAKQELAKEREKAKKLVDGCKFLLEFLEKHRPYVSGLGAPIHLIKQSLTEYEKL